MLFVIRNIRAAITWVMMPLALWSGLQAPECECTNGEHRFFCSRMLAAVRPAIGTAKVAPQHLCCSPTALKADEAKADSGQSGLRSTSESGPCGHCKAIISSPLATGQVVALPSLERSTWLPVNLVLTDANSVLSYRHNGRLQPSECWPSADRVIVYCSLLI